MIIIAFDFGTKNIGVAIGQKYTNTAYPLSSIKIKNNKLNLKVFKKLLDEWQPKIIIVGLPLNLDGSRQKITKKSETFAKTIHNQFKIPVILHDERLSTVEAKTIIFKEYGYKYLKKNIVDSVSAVVILESWLSN